MLPFIPLFILPVCCNQAQAPEVGYYEVDTTFVRHFDFTYADAAFLTGKKDYVNNMHFIEIPKTQAYREGMYLLHDTYYWFNKMYEAAQKDGITLKIISATRTFTEQVWIWDDKWEKRKAIYIEDKAIAASILEYNAMPGTSRHHWGTDIDLNSMNPQYFETVQGKKIYNWLVQHAADYGFCQTYDVAPDRTSGYKEEKWHWSFYPIANTLLNRYSDEVHYENLKGFKGYKTAEQLEVVKNYVLSVSNSCN